MKRFSLIAGLAAALLVFTSGAQAHSRDRHADIGLSLHFPHASLHLNNRHHHPQRHHNHRSHAHRGYSHRHNRRQQRHDHYANHHQRQHRHCRVYAPYPGRCMARLHNNGHRHGHR